MSDWKTRLWTCVQQSAGIIQLFVWHGLYAQQRQQNLQRREFLRYCIQFYHSSAMHIHELSKNRRFSSNESLYPRNDRRHAHSFNGRLRRNRHGQANWYLFWRPWVTLNNSIAHLTQLFPGRPHHWVEVNEVLSATQRRRWDCRFPRCTDRT